MTTGAHSDRYVVISADTHAGASIADYRSYLTQDLYDEFDAWATNFSDAWGAIDTQQMDTDDDNIRIGVASFALVGITLSIYLSFRNIAASASIPPTPQPTTPKPLTIVVCESVPTQVSGYA